MSIVVIFNLVLLHLFIYCNSGFQDIIFTLLTASNSGTIGLRKEFTLSIFPNDNPHGTVQFSQNMFTLQEAQGDSIQLVSLSRS